MHTFSMLHMLILYVMQVTGQSARSVTPVDCMVTPHLKFTTKAVSTLCTIHVKAVFKHAFASFTEKAWHIDNIFLKKAVQVRIVWQ